VILGRADRRRATDAMVRSLNLYVTYFGEVLKGGESRAILIGFFLTNI
jgi:hypothetical protein